MEEYKQALKIDKEESERYYRSSLGTKTEQQKQLEALLRPLNLEPKKIADIACGGGGTSYHLSALYPRASYTLVDMNEDAISLARESTRHIKATCVLGDVYDLGMEADTFDLVVCWQTLSWLSKPDVALRELVKICKPGGRVYASSLFNAHHDVDIYAMVKDHTRPSSEQGLSYEYNTYSVFSVRKWVADLVSDVRMHWCEIPIDLKHAGRGLGTYTAKLDDGKRLQISAGMLLNWGILELQK